MGRNFPHWLISASWVSCCFLYLVLAGTFHSLLLTQSIFLNSPRGIGWSTSSILPVFAKLTWSLVTFNITPSQDSFHFWPTPNHFFIWLVRATVFRPCSPASQEPLLTHSGSTFRGMCILMKPTWGDFLSSREEVLSGSWTIVGMCVFGDDGDSDWGDPFVTLCTLYQRVFVSKVNTCWGNEPLVSVRYWLLHLAFRVHGPFYPCVQSWMPNTIIAGPWFKLGTKFVWIQGSRNWVWSRSPSYVF